MGHARHGHASCVLLLYSLYSLSSLLTPLNTLCLWTWSGNCTKRPPRSRCSLARLFHAPRRLCCLRSITDETQSVSSAGSADCGSTTAAFSLPPPAIELTRRLWQGSGAVSAVVQEAARGEAVRTVGAHSSSPRPHDAPRRLIAVVPRLASRALSPLHRRCSSEERGAPCTCTRLL